MPRKPYGVWVLISVGAMGSGSMAWMFDHHATLDEAMLTARTLRFGRSGWRVWIALTPGAERRRAATAFYGAGKAGV